MTETEFVDVMTTFENAFTSLWTHACKTDRDDMLLCIQQHTAESKADVDKAVEMAREDDTVTLLQYGQLVWLNHALNDLHDVCERKLERLKYD